MKYVTYTLLLGICVGNIAFADTREPIRPMLTPRAIEIRTVATTSIRTTPFERENVPKEIMRGEAGTTTRGILPRIENKIENKIEDKKIMASSTVRIEERREATTSPIRRGTIQPGLKKQLEPMILRIDATIVRLLGIISRIDSRTTKIKNAGGNTSSAETLTLQAKTKINTAKANFGILKVSVSAIVESDTASSTIAANKEKIAILRKTAESIQKDLNDAQKLTEKSVEALRKAEKDLNKNTIHATTTTEAHIN